MNEPDSVYLFSYATVNDAGRSGLKLAGVQMQHAGSVSATDMDT